jgi:hypothetical protein
MARDADRRVAARQGAAVGEEAARNSNMAYVRKLIAQQGAVWCQ